MTLGDLFRGAWTWGQLARELLPVFMVAGSAFWAGYSRGWNVGARYVEAELEKRS